MNLILLFKEDLITPKKARLSGRRFEHARDILKVKIGSELTVGKVNGSIGSGKIVAIAKDSLELELNLKQKAPASLDLTLIMALPRPQMFKRTLQCVSALGVKKIIILNFAKVEKSLWQSSTLKPEEIRQDLILGLEQAKDTVLPKVILKKQFKPFVEDELPDLIKDKKAWVAHPGEKGKLSKIDGKGAVLIIGPEGGLVDFEVDLLKSKGVKAVTLGERILRFEHVIPYVIGKMSS